MRMRSLGSGMTDGWRAGTTSGGMIRCRLLGGRAIPQQSKYAAQVGTRLYGYCDIKKPLTDDKASTMVWDNPSE